MHPAPLELVTFSDCAASVRDDIDMAGFDTVVLVGHSLAGCSMPAMIGVLGDRVRHAVFVGCTVPEAGSSAFETLDPEVQALALAHGGADDPRTMDAEMAGVGLGTDLAHVPLGWC